MSSRTYLVRKGITDAKRRLSTGQHPGVKSASGPRSTARCVPRIGLHMISFVHASEETKRVICKPIRKHEQRTVEGKRTIVFLVFGAVKGKRTIVSWAHRTAAVLSRPAPPGPNNDDNNNNVINDDSNDNDNDTNDDDDNNDNNYDSNNDNDNDNNRTAARPCAARARRPARGRSGFWIRQVKYLSKSLI